MAGPAVLVTVNENGENGGKVKPRNLAGDFAGMVTRNRSPGKQGLLQERDPNAREGANAAGVLLRKAKCQKEQAAARADEHDARRMSALKGQRPSIDVAAGDRTSAGGVNSGAQLGGGKSGKAGKPPKSPVRGMQIDPAGKEDRWQQRIGEELGGEGCIGGATSEGGFCSSPAEKKPPTIERRLQSVMKWKHAVKEVLGDDEVKRVSSGRGKKRVSGEMGKDGKRARLSVEEGAEDSIPGAFSRMNIGGSQFPPDVSLAADVNKPVDESLQGALVLAEKGPSKPPLQFHPGASPPGINTRLRMRGDALAVYPKIRPSRLALSQGGGSESAVEWVRKLDDRTVKMTVPEGTEASKRNKKEVTCPGFTHVFGPATTQEDFFLGTTAASVDAFTRKHESCVVWAFGMTAAGKSYTMVGPENQQGLIPRAMDLILGSLARRGSQPVTFSVIENQNDRFYDLLVPPVLLHGRRQGALEFNSGNGTVKGAQEVMLTSAEHGKAELRKALANRHTERTDLNAASSRSHAIFEFRLGDPRAVDTELRARLCFVDLAGSERLDRTHNVGDRLKESLRINSTLTTIFQCLKATRENQEALGRAARSRARKVPVLKQVPYRDSKISHMFRKELSGQGDSILVVCLSPDPEDFDETMQQLEKAKEAAKIRIFCEVEPTQQPWSVVKAPRHGAPSPAARWRPEFDIGRLSVLEEENQRLRQQLMTMSARMGDDGRFEVLESEKEILRQQVTSLTAELEEEARARLRVAEQTEAAVRKEVVAEFEAALEQRKAADGEKLERALQAERRKFERELAKLRETHTCGNDSRRHQLLAETPASAGACDAETPTTARDNNEATPASARSRSIGGSARKMPPVVRLLLSESEDGSESEGLEGLEARGMNDGVSRSGAPGTACKRNEEPAGEESEVGGPESERLEHAKFDDRRTSTAGAEVRGCTTEGSAKRVSLQEGQTPAFEPSLGDSAQPARDSAGHLETPESSSGSESDSQSERRTVRQVRDPAPTVTPLSDAGALPRTEGNGMTEEKAADVALAACQERCRQLEATIAALQKAASTAEMGLSREGEVSAHHVRVQHLTAVEDAVTSGQEFTGGVEEMDTCQDRIGTLMTSDEEGRGKEPAARDKADGKSEDEFEEEVEKLKEELDAREGRHFKELAEARATAAALRARIVEFELAVERHVSRIEEVRREEASAAEEASADVILQVQNETREEFAQYRAEKDAEFAQHRAEKDVEFARYRKERDEELERERTDAHSLRMEIEMLEDQLERQREETDKLSARYHSLLGRVAASSPKPQTLRSHSATPLVGPFHTSPARHSGSRNRLLETIAPPSPGFSSPLGRAISAAVNKPLEVIPTQTEPPREALGLGLLTVGAGCEQADEMESPSQRSMLRSPFTLLMSAQKTPTAGSPTSPGRRSPSFAYLANNRAFGPTPRVSQGAFSHRSSKGNGSGDQNAGLSGLAESLEQDGGSPEFARDRTTGRRAEGSSQKDERRQSESALEPDVETSLTEKGEEFRATVDFRAKEDGNGGSNRCETGESECKGDRIGLVEDKVGLAEPCFELQLGVEDSPQPQSVLPVTALPRGSPLLNEELPAVETTITEHSQCSLPDAPDELVTDCPDADSPGLVPRADEETFPLVSPMSGASEPSLPNSPVASPEGTRESDPLQEIARNGDESTAGEVHRELPNVVQQPGRFEEGVNQTQNEADLSPLGKVDVDEGPGGGFDLTLTQPVSRFQRGKQRAAELFKPLRPGKDVPVDESGVESDLPVRERCRPFKPGPVGLLLQETVGVPLPELADSVAGHDNERVRELIARQGGALDIAHYERTKGLRLSKDKILCMRFCFALLSERWRDASSGDLFPLEKRTSVAKERIDTFGAVVRAKTIKDAAARAREGLKVCAGLGRAAPGKENSDPREGEIVAAPVRRKPPGRLAELKTTETRSPRLRRQTRSFARGLKPVVAAEKQSRPGDETEEDESSSEAEEQLSERDEPNNAKGLTSHESPRASPTESPYIPSGAKRFVPITSVYARPTPKVRVTKRGIEAQAAHFHGRGNRPGGIDLDTAQSNDRDNGSGELDRDAVDLAGEEIGGTAAESEGHVSEAEPNEEIVGPRETRLRSASGGDATRGGLEGLEKLEEGKEDEKEPRSGREKGAVKRSEARGPAEKAKRKRPRLQPRQRCVDLEEALGETDGSPVHEVPQSKSRRLGVPGGRRTRNALRFLL